MIFLIYFFMVFNLAFSSDNLSEVKSFDPLKDDFSCEGAEKFKKIGENEVFQFSITVPAIKSNKDNQPSQEVNQNIGIEVAENKFLIDLYELSEIRILFEDKRGEDRDNFNKVSIYVIDYKVDDGAQPLIMHTTFGKIKEFVENNSTIISSIGAAVKILPFSSNNFLEPKAFLDLETKMNIAGYCSDLYLIKMESNNSTLSFGAAFSDDLFKTIASALDAKLLKTIVDFIIVKLNKIQFSNLSTTLSFFNDNFEERGFLTKLTSGKQIKYVLNGSSFVDRDQSIIPKIEKREEIKKSDFDLENIVSKRVQMNFLAKGIMSTALNRVKLNVDEDENTN